MPKKKKRNKVQLKFVVCVCKFVSGCAEKMLRWQNVFGVCYAEIRKMFWKTGSQTSLGIEIN